MYKRQALAHVWPWGDANGWSHLTSQGFMPNGPKSVVVALLGVMFAFIGAEIVTVAAAESADPGREIIRTCLLYTSAMPTPS